MEEKWIKFRLKKLKNRKLFSKSHSGILIWGSQTVQNKNSKFDRINIEEFKRWADKISSNETNSKKFLIDSGINNEDGSLCENYGGKPNDKSIADLNHVVINSAMNIMAMAIGDEKIQEECSKIISEVREFSKEFNQMN
jgi:hypothetical protein